ncbi:MAG: hypothetical protein ABJC10_10775 [Acidobacteriota bacterium]
MSAISKTWGTEPEERRVAFPCDYLISQPDDVLYRGITIYALPNTVFRWLCQMRAAPYSYDWIDNGGRQSPSNLTPGLEDLAVGQEVMRIFDLIRFAKDRQLTLRLKGKSSASRTFGDIAVTYLIIPVDNRSTQSCRLLVKLVAKYPRGLYGRAMRMLLPWGDLIMMRRQLLNLKRLAEATEKGRTNQAQRLSRRGADSR